MIYPCCRSGAVVLIENFDILAARTAKERRQPSVAELASSTLAPVTVP